MKKYRVVELVTLNCGVVGLTDRQASRRGGLKRIGDGQYEITAPNQFKVGEEIGLSECPKGIEHRFFEIKSAKAEINDPVPTVKKKAAVKKKRVAKKKVVK